MEKIKPREIEKRSFEIISKELANVKINSENELVVKRCIHASADFDYSTNLCFSSKAVLTIMEALKNGCDIVTDTKMAMSGINKRVLKELGCEVHCYISNEDVIHAAKLEGTTRSAISMRKSIEIKKPVLYAIGNAPTALIELHRLINEDGLSPVGIIGVPVGFVNVIESKEMIMNLNNVPYIVAKGRKGGSTIAAAIVNAILYQIQRDDL